MSHPNITQEDLDNWFTYHAPKGDQVERYQEIREKAKELAEVILDNCPHSADRTSALRALRVDVVMSANASIACNE